MTSGRRRILGLGAVSALAAVGVAGLALQVLGQPANHPQLEAAHTAVSRLDHGDKPSDVVPASTVDIATSTDLFLIVTDGQRNVLASSASVSGAQALPPPGVFDYVRSNGEDRVTWQPAAGVRSWIVVDSYNGGFVIAGRSPSGGEQNAYLLLLWGSLGALGLAVLVGAGMVLYRF